MRKNSILSIFLIFAFSISAYAQQITGSVTDENGIPLPGASVVVEGTSNGVTTNFDGNYSIETSQGDVLVFRFVGYQSQSITVESSSAMNVQLMPNNALSEVVVTALGISREKKSLGYSVSEVSGESINDVKDDNIANSLIGKVAGLQITQSGGIGSGSRITIRGNNSLGGNTQALIVVDGVPINSSGINSGSNDDGGATFRSSISGGGISDINSDDVESISVLKGPTAAALYGSRAGNGVILVTTKKGTNSDKLGVTINSNISVDSPMFLPDYQNEYGHGTLGAAPTDITQLTRSSWGSRARWITGSLYYNGEQS
jgi:TonB-dependent SusC/RagA subfamily outer membrane receptor